MGKNGLEKKEEIYDDDKIDGVEIPHDLICPITHELFADPVMTIDGFTFEKRAIEEWFKTHRTSPVTNEELPDLTLIPNRALKGSIEAFKANPRATVAVVSGIRKKSKLEKSDVVESVQDIVKEKKGKEKKGKEKTGVSFFSFLRKKDGDKRPVNKSKKNIDVAMVGYDAPGCTSILQQMLHSRFLSRPEYTTHTIYEIKETAEYIFNFWDFTSAKDLHKYVLSNYFGRVGIFIYVFDLTYRYTFDGILEYLVEDASSRPNGSQIILVGNKMDAQEKIKVSSGTASALAAIFDAKYLEVSAKTRENIGTLFNCVEQMAESYMVTATDAKVALEGERLTIGDCKLLLDSWGVGEQSASNSSTSSSSSEYVGLSPDDIDEMYRLSA